MATAEAILQDALLLPDDLRADLALRLHSSLDDASDEGAEDAWAAEIAVRVARLRAGEARTRPAADVLSDARSWLRQRRG